MSRQAPEIQRVGLVDAAILLGLGYWACRDRLLRGALRGGRDERGHLWVSSDSVEEARATMTTSGSGR